MADERKPVRVVVIGANHRSSAEATRDRLFIGDDAQPDVLRRARDAGLSEAIAISTCARTELIGIADEDRDPQLGLLAMLAEIGDFGPDDLAGQTYTLEGEHAIRHVFRVAASLDSPIVGEPQVTGQFRDAVRLSEANDSLGAGLDRIARAAAGAAKRVRTETAIGERPVSMAACAVQVARDVQGDLSQRSALLISGGELGEMVTDGLRKAGLSQLTVIARSEARAQIAARRFDCHHAGLGDLADLLPRADVVVSSMGASRYLIDHETAGQALAARRRRPVLFVDAAIPSDVEPTINDLDGAFVYSIEDLERLALKGRSLRGEAAAAAEAIIAEEVERFRAAEAGRTAVPAVVALRDHFEQLRRDIVGGAESADPEELTRRLIARLLHDPSETLRRIASSDEQELRRMELAVQRLFGLTGNDDPGGTPGKEEEDP